MNKDFEIRKAEKKDASAIQRLVLELAEYEREKDAVITSAHDLEQFGFGPHALFESFVAESDSKIVGFALCYWKYSTWKGRSLYLEDFYVQPSHRASGLGHELFKRVVRLAYTQQCERLEWVVLDWNELALKFYKKRGATILSDWSIGQMGRNDMENLLK